MTRTKYSHRIRWKIAVKQNFDCNMCHQKLTEETDLDHIIALGDGGKDEFDNLQLLHLNCHRVKCIFENVARNKKKSEMYCEKCNVYFSKFFVSDHVHIQ